MALAVAGSAVACARPAREDDAAERDAGFERVGIDDFRSDGASASLVDGATHGGGAVVVGSVAGEAGPESVAPIVLESANGIDWQRTELGPLSGTASLAAVAVGAGGKVLAAGTVAGPDGDAAPALWRRDGGGQWSGPMTPGDLPRDLTVLPRGLAGGPAGFMLAGSRGGHFEVWTSPTGDGWDRASGHPLGSPPVLVVGEEFVAFVSSRNPEVGRVDVLMATAGGELERVDRIDGSGVIRMYDAAYVDGQYLAVGGDRAPAGEYMPATWASEGPSSWAEGPRLEDASSAGSTAGSWASSIAIDLDGQVLVTSLDGTVWGSGDAADDAYPSYGRDALAPGGSIAVLPAGEPTVFTSDQILGSGDDGWEDRASFVIPSPTRTVRVTGVAHGAGGFVAVGSQRRSDPDARGGARVQGLAWRSPDGRDWESVPDQTPLAGTSLLDVAAYEGGFVAVGLSRDDAAPAAGRIFVSADGSEWEKVDDENLRPSEGGIHQLESVVAYGDGFIATGFGADDNRIAPLILVSSDGTSVLRADVPAPSTGDQISLGACASGDTAMVVGGAEAASSTPLAWRSGDGDRWEQMPAESPDASGLIVCSMSQDGRIVAGGNVRVAGGTGVVAGVATNPSLEMRPLPGAIFGDIVRGATWVGDIPVVVAEPARTNFGPGALVWLATSNSALDWTRLTSDTLAAPAVSGATGVAYGEGVLVVTGETLTGGAAWTASADEVLGR